MPEQLRTSWLVADFFTRGYRISGRVDVRRRKLADQLNDHTTAFLLLEDTYVSNIERPADITASHTSSVLRKDNITAVVVARQEDGLPREYTYGSYFSTYLRKVFIIVPSFEIEGYLRLSGKLDLRTVLTTGTDTFVSILDGQMRSSLHSDVTFTGGAILVNKDHIGAFWVEEEA
ncbi:MAG: hypothetical protein DRI79_04110 [Chloroflexi bacterium]|nr:MAG: hypothetical protein DRI79_04110 [Chloroflexota bacterium]